MTEQEVWQGAMKIWEKKEKIDLCCIELCFNGDDWLIKIAQSNLSYVATRYFETTVEVRRFLDGLE